TIPEKRKGIERHMASSAHIKMEVIERVTTGVRLICTTRQSKVDRANAVLKYDKSQESVFSVNRSRRR
ncbi:MAG TPA: hypothetical protein VFQ43_02545, partial [Nitrososphaera sp.]|nr:hypothetical protein [Nitrososphaera sp.]